jgi:hypothetical protein
MPAPKLIPDILFIHRSIPLGSNRPAWQLMGVAGSGRPFGGESFRTLPPRMRRTSFGMKAEEATGRAIEEEA